MITNYGCSTRRARIALRYVRGYSWVFELIAMGDDAFEAMRPLQ